MEIFLKLIAGILGFVILEVFYAYAFEHDNIRQLGIGATLDPNGLKTARLASRRKDNIARGIALLYMLFMSSMFNLFRVGISPGRYKLSIAGVLTGFALMFLLFVLRDYFKASEFERAWYGGKVFLVTTRLIAYIFILCYFF